MTMLTVAGSIISFLALLVTGIVGWFTRSTIDSINRQLEMTRIWIEEIRQKLEKHSEGLAHSMAKTQEAEKRFITIQDELLNVRYKLGEVEKTLVGVSLRLDILMNHTGVGGHSQ